MQTKSVLQTAHTRITVLTCLCCGVGLASINDYFYCFLTGEIEQDYTWALNSFQFILNLTTFEKLVFVMDLELELMNALDTAFRASPNLICKWHIWTNLVSNLQNNRIIPWGKAGTRFHHISGS